MVIAPLLTADLLEHGYAAATEKVWGWLDDECRLLGFGHLVTVIDGRLVVDATATLYSDSLPAPWVCALDDYTEALARASGMRRVIIGSLTRPENGE